MPAIEYNKSAELYWTLYFFGVAYIVIVIGLFVYVVYCVSTKGSHHLWPIDLLKELFTLIPWIFYGPFMESFIGVFKCSDGVHKIDNSMRCYKGVHIFFIIFSIIMGIVLLLLTLLCALFYTETSPIKENSLAKRNQVTEVLIILFRFIVIIYTSFVYNVFSC